MDTDIWNLMSLPHEKQEKLAVGIMKVTHKVFRLH
jgi:hypothetical protein